MKSLRLLWAASLVALGAVVLAGCDKTDPTAPENSTINVLPVS